MVDEFHSVDLADKIILRYRAAFQALDNTASDNRWAIFQALKMDDHLIELIFKLSWRGFITSDECWEIESERSYLLSKYGFTDHNVDTCPCVGCVRVREQVK